MWAKEPVERLSSRKPTHYNGFIWLPRLITRRAISGLIPDYSNPTPVARKGMGIPACCLAAFLVSVTSVIATSRPLGKTRSFTLLHYNDQHARVEDAQKCVALDVAAEVVLRDQLALTPEQAPVVQANNSSPRACRSYSDCTGVALASNKCYGGFARMATVVQQVGAQGW